MRQATKNEEEQFLAFEKKRLSEKDEEDGESDDDETKQFDQDLSELASIRHYFSFSLFQGRHLRIASKQIQLMIITAGIFNNNC